MGDELTRRGGHAETEKAAGALPGGAEVDRDLVLEALGHVARLRNGSTLEGWLEIGDYLMETFFDGSIQKYRAQAPHHASFRALADRHDLPVSRVALWRAVSVAEQVRELEPDVGRALPFTHHTLLLSVSDPELKHRLARTCVAESWSKRRLEAEVRRVRGPTRRGRKIIPKSQGGWPGREDRLVPGRLRWPGRAVDPVAGPAAVDPRGPGSGGELACADPATGGGCAAAVRWLRFTGEMPAAAVHWVGCAGAMPGWRAENSTS